MKKAIPLTIPDAFKQHLFTQLLPNGMFEAPNFSKKNRNPFNYQSNTIALNAAEFNAGI